MISAAPSLSQSGSTAHLEGSFNLWVAAGRGPVAVCLSRRAVAREKRHRAAVLQIRDARRELEAEQGEEREDVFRIVTLLCGGG